MVDLQGSANQQELAGAEEDLLNLFEALHRLCDPLMPFHVHNKDADLPTAKVHEYAHEYAVPSCPPGAAAPVGSPTQSSASAEEIAAPQHMWLANLLNAFGERKGFDLICQVHMTLLGSRVVFAACERWIWMLVVVAVVSCPC